MRPPESLGVLRVREFRLLFTAQAVSVVGDRLVPVALAFAVLRLGGTPTEVGLVLASRTVTLVAALLVGGVVADRVPRRHVMIAADLARFLTQGVLAVLLIGGAASVGTVALLAGLTGAGTGFFNPASTGLLPTVVRPDRLQEANGLRATAMAGGEIAGPLIGGLLIAAAGPGWAFAVDAASFAVSAALLVRLRVAPDEPRAASSFVADLREGWATFRSLRWLWTFVASAALGNVLWGAWSVLGPVIAQHELGGAAVWGSILAAMGVGALAGAVLAVRVRPRRPLVLATAAAIWGPLSAVLGVSASLWVAAGLLAASLVAVLAVPDVRSLEAPVMTR